MVFFKTTVDCVDNDVEFDFNCYDNTEPIKIGDAYIFFFCGITDVQICDSKSIESEINYHDRPHQDDKIDLVYNFWRSCYKIKSTNLDLSTIDN